MLRDLHVSSLTAIFGSGAEKEQDSEKLMDLYWNRAELKKEFADMRKEQYRLKDKIKQQEGITARVQQKLDHLQGLLTDPKWAHNVVVHFQLRGLSLQCQQKLANFAEQLKQQRERKQYDHIVGDWNSKIAAEVEAVQQRILDKQESIYKIEGELQAERSRLASMSSIVRFFKGRSITAKLDRLAELIEQAQLEEQLLGQESDELRNKEPPDAQGLDVPTKRSINLMILAFAQQMYAHFHKDELAELIREAGEKSVGAINYGNHGDCNRLLKRMAESVENMERKSDFTGVLQQRAKLIGERAEYGSSSDAVPVSQSVAILYTIEPDGRVNESSLDMLGANYWEIARILSR